MAHKSLYTTNRVQVFKSGDLKLWIDGYLWSKDARGKDVISGAKLTLERRKPGTKSKWEGEWFGVVSYSIRGVTVDTTSLRKRTTKIA